MSKPKIPNMIIAKVSEHIQNTGFPIVRGWRVDWEVRGSECPPPPYGAQFCWFSHVMGCIPHSTGRSSLYIKVCSPHHLSESPISGFPLPAPWYAEGWVAPNLYRVPSAANSLQFYAKSLKNCPFQHVSPTFQHVSPTFQHVPPIFQHVSPTYQHVSPTFQHVSPTFQHASPIF